MAIAARQSTGAVQCEGAIATYVLYHSVSKCFMLGWRLQRSAIDRPGVHCPYLGSSYIIVQCSALVQSSNRARLPEVFHVSPRSRSIAYMYVHAYVWCDAIMPAIDQKPVFRLQANDVTWPAQRLNMLNLKGLFFLFCFNVGVT